MRHSAALVTDEDVNNIIALDTAPPVVAPEQENEVKGEGEGFTFEGRWYQLFKRGDGRKANYYVRIMLEGKRVRNCLNTNVKSVAEVRGKQWVAKVKARKWQDVDKLKARRTSALFCDITKLYLPSKEYPNGLGLITGLSARNNVWAFGKILKMVYGVTEPGAVSLDKVNKMLVRDFQEKMVNMYLNREKGAGAERLRLAREVAQRSSRSIVHQARSLFNKRTELVAKYERHGLKIPACVQDFMTCKLEGKDSKREYLQPPDEVVQAAFTNIENVMETDLEVYLAFWLATGVGLRRGEILRAQWEHFTLRGETMWYVGGCGKDGQQIVVPVQERAWKALEPHRKETGRVLGENATMEFARRINWWMVTQGWKTEKKLHELRAYVGSLIYLKDPVAAMKFLRHKTIKQTETAYARYGRVATQNVL